MLTFYSQIVLLVTMETGLPAQHVLQKLTPPPGRAAQLLQTAYLVIQDTPLLGQMLRRHAQVCTFLAMCNISNCPCNAIRLKHIIQNIISF